ncbi:MAG TPA: carbamoyltransferase N-terminal domain-containing protein, partial [Gemmatimonas sp.]|uniref:carbamoyltransferase family protein n=1 Tax=Gemmatimonas sp. TaxID=1962908 RepID=UPI002ED8C7BA
MTTVLGISAFFHDSAACLVRDGVIVAAASEERFSRRKGDASFPALAASWCLSQADVDVHALDAVAYYEKPILHLDRLLESWMYTAPRGWRAFLKGGPLWARDKVDLDGAIREGLGGYRGQLLWCEHHESHAASAFFPSPFRRAAVLTIDGVGEWATASMGIGHDATLQLTHELRYPDSLGLLYSACTYQAGFRVNSGEYKLMGLAPFGTPRYVDAILSHLVDLRDDGSFRLHLAPFGFHDGLRMTNSRFDALFGGPPREPDAPITTRDKDLAASVQVVTEMIVRRMVNTLVKEHDCREVCLAGGVALNAVANGMLLRERLVDRLWVQPAAGDAGGAIGAALLAWHRWFGGSRAITGENGNADDGMNGALLGPAFTEEAILEALTAEQGVFEYLGREGVAQRTAEWLAEGKIVGWFDGAMEFGPRALGARSILADPRVADMQQRLNAHIKLREGFRPFAPVVLAEHASDYFENIEGDASPYMLLVVPVRAEAPVLPAIKHHDGTARIQTVTAQRTPGLHTVLTAFHESTGC